MRIMDGFASNHNPALSADRERPWRTSHGPLRRGRWRRVSERRAQRGAGVSPRVDRRRLSGRTPVGCCSRCFGDRYGGDELSEERRSGSQGLCDLSPKRLGLVRSHCFLGLGSFGCILCSFCYRCWLEVVLWMRLLHFRFAISLRNASVRSVRCCCALSALASMVIRWSWRMSWRATARMYWFRLVCFLLRCVLAPEVNRDGQDDCFCSCLDSRGRALAAGLQLGDRSVAAGFVALWLVWLKAFGRLVLSFAFRRWRRLALFWLRFEVAR